MLTLQRIRTAALTMAFAEVGNRHIPRADREALKMAADAATLALLAAAEQVLGIVLAKLQWATLPHTFDEHPDVTITSAELPDIELFLDQLATAGNLAMTTGIHSHGIVQEPWEVTANHSPAIKQQYDFGSKLVKGVLQNYAYALNNRIADGIQAGKSREQIKDDLLHHLGASADLMPEWRARLIAQTEVIRSYNGAARESMQAAGAQYVRWLDGQTGACPDCAALDGAIIPLNNGLAFSSAFRGLTTKHPPLHPGCRCSISAAEHEDYASQPNFSGTNVSDPSGGVMPLTHLPADLHSPKKPVPYKPLAPDILQPAAVTTTPDLDMFASWLADNGYSGLTNLASMDDALEVYSKGYGVSAKEMEGLLKAEMGAAYGSPLSKDLLNKAIDAAKAKTAAKTGAGAADMPKSVVTLEDAAAKVIATIGANPLVPLVSTIKKISEESGLAYGDVKIALAKKLGVPDDVYSIKDAIKAKTAAKTAAPAAASLYDEAAELIAKGTSAVDEIKEYITTSGKKPSDYLHAIDGFSDFVTAKFGSAGLITAEGKAFLGKLKDEMGFSSSMPTSGLVKELHAKWLKDDMATMATPAALHPVAMAFKNWHDQFGSPGGEPLTGVSALQAYSKFTGKPMKTISDAIKLEGYETKHLVSAPKGIIPAPTGKVKPPLPPGVKSAVKPPTAAQMEFRTTFTDADIPEGKTYWDAAKKTGEAKGSNPGGFYTGPDGQQFYLKKYAKADQASTEIAAQKIYNLLGIETPRAKMVLVNGEMHYVSKMIDGLQQLTGAELHKYMVAHPEIAAKIHVASVFTQNWDVIGLTGDNLLFNPKTGKLVAVDVGGTFTFRAKGGAKSYDTVAKEWESLLDSNTNAISAQVFKNLYSNPKALLAAEETAKFLKQQLNYIDQNLIISGVSKTAMLSKLDDLLDRIQTEVKVSSIHTSLAPGKYQQLSPQDHKLYSDVKDSIIAKALSTAGIQSEMRSFARGWSGSSTSPIGREARSSIRSMLTGIDKVEAYIQELKAYAGSTYDMARDAKNRAEFSQGHISDEAVAQIYKENQASLRKEFPSGFVHLKRGIKDNSPGGREAIEAVADAFKQGRPGKWNPTGLESFSNKPGFAERWADGMVVEFDVPIEAIFLDKGWLKDHGGPHTEGEYIVIGAPGGYTLTPANTKLSSRYKNFSEPLLPADWDIGNADPVVIHLPLQNDLNGKPEPPLPESEQDWETWQA